jgi:hypothetical protein
MPQCQFHVFCCFCVSEKLHRKYSRNWTKQKPNLLLFNEASRSPKRRRRGATGWPHSRAVQPSPWPRPLCVRPPWSTSDDAPSPIRSVPMENPKTIGKFPERVPQLHRSQRRISGDRSLCSGTLPGRGSAPGASPSVSITVSAVSIDLTAISIVVAASDDEEGVVLPRG